MKIGSILLLAAVAAGAVGADAKTKVMFFFDTEDFTCDESSDAIRDTANVLAEEGVVGEYNIVGYLARELVANRRQDVIDAMKKHHVGTQTLGHSVHPAICELSDREDFREAYRLVAEAENQGVGMLKAAFGLDRVSYAVPPGNSVSYVAMYAYADMGMVFYAAGGIADDTRAGGGPSTTALARRDNLGLGLWYCNMYQIPYSHILSLQALIPGYSDSEPDVGAAIEKMAQRDLVALYMHPHIAIKTGHWDGPNYTGTNVVEYGKWIQVPDRPKEATREFYARLRDFIRRLKADGRFELTNLNELEKTLKPRVAIRRADIPAVRAALARKFGPVSEPASWSVADVFQAAVRFLRDPAAEESAPGKAYGFLSKPIGVSERTEVAAAELRAAAERIDLGYFIPSEIELSEGRRIGPADFLFAALEALETGADSVAVEPREQLGTFEEVPGIERFRITRSGEWGWIIHAFDFKDAWLSDRLRLQLWTLRLE